MTLAERLGMTLAECQRRVTHREYLLWQARFEAEWSSPSRSDHYLMEVVCEVRRLGLRVSGILGGKVDLDSVKPTPIKFGRKKQLSGKNKRKDFDTQVQLSKARTLAALGLPLPTQEGTGGD